MKVNHHTKILPLYESKVLPVGDTKKTLENLEDLKPTRNPKDTSRKSWLYIFGAVVLIFGLTFLFQQLSEPNKGEVVPSDIEMLQHEVDTLNEEVSSLQSVVAELETRIDTLENK
ncbi:Hypothetical protein Tpal_2000 [Trichococcus palustris]|jgi:uncharacterized protein YlxW (UPF0749 family)|uniref:Uncharacterized protein n=1 Tax=Trichococcus palustris TaxID=140314 RepID=A0A143YQ98_9LACT|nr:Hypothetical protein Tpal_2000 [Trichococcus palustris]SFK73388.1 hypothetical protein SAMN04488076_10437 [Trichococcus palustris]